MESRDFHTQNGYLKREKAELTPSMEDYLEMIFRLTHGLSFTRVHELAHALHVNPSSATKMVQRLAQSGYVQYEKYGYILLKERGGKVGSELLDRHLLIERFLRLIGVEEASLLEETEKIEHMLNAATTDRIRSFVRFMLENPDIADRYAAFCRQQKKDDGAPP